MAAIIVAALLLLIAIIMGPQFLAASLLIGSPTVFGFPNEILRPLPFITMERLLLVLLATMVFLRYAFTKERTRWLSLEITMIVFLVYAFISLLLHTNRVMLSQDGWLWIQYLLPMVSFIVSRRMEWTDRGLKILLACLTVTGVFVASIGILQSLFGVHLFRMNYQTITAGHEMRSYGTFSSAHTYVATLFIFLALTLLQFSIYKDALVRFLLLTAMALMSIGIVLGETRAPWLGAMLAFLVIFARHREVRPVMLLGGALALVAVLVIFASMIDQLDSFIARLTDVNTMAGRFATWATAVNMITDHPLFGVGFGASAYSLHKPEYITGIGSLTAQFAAYLGVPHNEYLHVAVLLGMLGLVLFLMILVRLVKLMFQTFNTTDDDILRKYLALYVGAIIVGLMFNSLFSDTYIQDYFWVLTYFMAGIAAGNAGVQSSQFTEAPTMSSHDGRTEQPA